MGDPEARGPVRVIPTDTRPAQQALVEPAPIIGGTLAVTADGRVAVVSDPDRNTVSIVDLTGREVRARVTLNAGDEPGRVTIDNTRGIAHVALRRSGELAAIDLAQGTLLRRNAVCPAPRGTTYDGRTDRLFVACADGQLVSLSADTGDVAFRERLGVDLRDVVVVGDELLVTRFKSAEALHVTKQGVVMKTSTAANMDHTRNGAVHGFDAAVAWRAVAAPDGEVVMLHQRAQNDTIAPGPVVADMPPTPAYYGGDAAFGANCTSIVHSALSTFNTEGRTATSAPLSDAVMAVDVAVSGDKIAIAVAGSIDPTAPRPFMRDEFGPTFVSPPTPVEVIEVSRYSLSVDGSGSASPFGSGCASATTISGTAQVTAVAYMPDGTLVSQVREPSALRIHSPFTGVTSVDLGGESVADTGHDLFHRDSGSGIACAQCHMEGGDDGRVWRFNEIGERRTQAVHVGLEDTAPFHWDGDVASIHDLMGQVFVGRMGGVHQSDARLDTLRDWMFAVQPPEAIRAADEPAAMRGHALFNAPEVGCATCHSGAKLTNNQTVNVGTGDSGERFQVPSLVAIGYRAPFVHTGCAGTLRERFTNTECGGGDAHGTTSQLDETQIDDLVAYLETL